MDRRRCRSLLGLLLRLLTCERGNLGTVFGYLAQQDLTLSADQCRVRISWRYEVLHGIVPGRESRAQPCDIELLGDEFVVQAIAFRRIYGRIKLDQRVTRLDHLPIL